MLDAGGRLRWARLDNLLAESRKSQGFDPAQLWLLADWLLTEAAPPLRRTLADEAARLLDAAVAGASAPQGRVLQELRGYVGDFRRDLCYPKQTCTLSGGSVSRSGRAAWRAVPHVRPRRAPCASRPPAPSARCLTRAPSPCMPSNKEPLAPSPAADADARSEPG